MVASLQLRVQGCIQLLRLHLLRELESILLRNVGRLDSGLLREIHIGYLLLLWWKHAHVHVLLVNTCNMVLLLLKLFNLLLYGELFH